MVFRKRFIFLFPLSFCLFYFSRASSFGFPWLLAANGFRSTFSDPTVFSFLRNRRVFTQVGHFASDVGTISPLVSVSVAGWMMCYNPLNVHLIVMLLGSLLDNTLSFWGGDSVRKQTYPHDCFLRCGGKLTWVLYLYWLMVFSQLVQTKSPYQEVTYLFVSSEKVDSYSRGSLSGSLSLTFDSLLWFESLLIFFYVVPSCSSSAGVSRWVCSCIRISLLRSLFFSIPALRGRFRLPSLCICASVF